MKLLSAAAIALGIVFARVSTAREFDLDLTAEAGYSSNVFRLSKNQVSDLSYRFYPTIRIRDEHLPLTYEVSYDPVFVGYLEHTDASVWDQRAGLKVDRVFGARTRLSMEERFSYSSSRLFENIGDVEVTEPDIGFTRTIRHHATATAQHRLTERATGYVIVAHQISRSEREDDADWDYLSGSLTLTRLLAQRDVLGVGGAVSYRSFDEVDDTVEIGGGYWAPGSISSRTLACNGFLYAKHAFGDDLVMTLRAGPAWLQQTQLIRLQAGGWQTKTRSDRLTWFGTVEVVKRWRKAALSATYTRQETAIATFNQSGVLDALTALAFWEPNNDWRLQLRGSFSLREGESKSERTRTKVWNGSVLVQRRLTKRSSLRCSLGYHKQRDNFGAGLSAYEDYWARVGFRYDFSAIRF